MDKDDCIEYDDGPPGNNPLWIKAVREWARVWRELPYEKKKAADENKDKDSINPYTRMDTYNLLMQIKQANLKNLVPAIDERAHEQTKFHGKQEQLRLVEPKYFGRKHHRNGASVCHVFNDMNQL